MSASLPDVVPRPAVPARPLADLVSAVGAQVRTADPAVVAGIGVLGVTHDSTAVAAGDLFVALPGARVHGAAFAAEAAAGGAVAILTDEAGAAAASATGVPVLVVDEPRAVLGAVSAAVYGAAAGRSALQVLGVTGTNGKTTVAFLLAAGFAGAGVRCGLMGTLGTRIGEDWIVSPRTTPEAPEVHARLALMAERGCTAAAIEVSSHALALHRVDGVRFAVAGFTNLARDHLDFHGDMESYFAAKASLFTPARSDRGVVCVDGPYGRRLAEIAGIGITTVDPTPGGADADVRVLDARSTADGEEVTVVLRDGRRQRLTTRLPGAHNAANAVLALALLIEAGVEPAAAAAGIAALPGVPGRMEPVDAGQPFRVLVDYAHTPDAVERALAVARAPGGRVLVVLGCGGDRDPGKREAMGAAAARLADVAVLTSDNPRSEDPAAIVAAMQRGVAEVPHGATVSVELDRADAIASALAAAQPGDTVLIAGKGHEQGQEAGGVVRPFDDRQVARQALAGLGWAPA